MDGHHPLPLEAPGPWSQGDPAFIIPGLMYFPLSQTCYNNGYKTKQNNKPDAVIYQVETTTEVGGTTDGEAPSGPPARSGPPSRPHRTGCRAWRAALTVSTAGPWPLLVHTLRGRRERRKRLPARSRGSDYEVGHQGPPSRAVKLGSFVQCMVTYPTATRQCLCMWLCSQ